MTNKAVILERLEPPEMLDPGFAEHREAMRLEG